MPLPRDADPRVHVTSPLGTNRHRVRGIVGHRQDRVPVTWGAFPVSDPVTAFIELGGILELDRLVAVGDWMALTPRRRMPGDPRPFVGPETLLAAASATRAWGSRRAREAAALVRVGAESPKETEVRLLLLRAGFPEPELGVAVRDRHGAHIGYFDLVWQRWKVAVEYDGDQHRTDPAQYEKDIARFDRASAARWRVVRVRKSGLTPRGIPDTLARVLESFQDQDSSFLADFGSIPTQIGSRSARKPRGPAR